MNHAQSTNGSSPPIDAVPHTALPDLTIIVPTRNEAGNIDALIERIGASVGERSVEVLFVDDSDDATPDVVAARANHDQRLAIRVLHRASDERRGGLGSAVVAGLRRARGAWVVVMDGDLQHPPELALRLADVGRSRGMDMVVASRNVGSGNADGLGRPTRHAVSGAATAATKAVFPRRLAAMSDPLSGFFAVRTDALDLDRLEPSGFKILMEIVVRHPGLRLAEVPFGMEPRLSGSSKATVREGLRFLHHLARLRAAVLVRQVARSAEPRSTRWLGRAFVFGLVGLSGLVVNTGVLWLLHAGAAGLHYLVAAVVATEASTSWLFVLTEALVFRGTKPGTRRGRAVRFFLLNHIALMGRLPLLAVLVEILHVNVLVGNVMTMVLLFAVRFLVADAAIYGSGNSAAACNREPIRIVVDLSEPAVADTGVVVPAPRGSRPSGRATRYLPYRYAIPDVATIGSQVRLPELEWFRAQHVGNDTDIQLRVAPTGTFLPRRRATMMQVTAPPAIRYSEHLGRLGANFAVELGDPIVLTVAPPLAHSPHVVYTNILEALLRFVAVSKGVMLLHSACVELNGVGMLISAETDTGKTGTVLRMVREHGARFLSDDMTILHPDGRVGCFPKPLTISHHTLRAVGSDELSAREWRRLQLQSRLHSREGRQFAMVLSRLNIPIMGVNALTQRLVPPPKYAVDRLLPCRIVPTTEVSELFVISRGPHGAGELPRSDAMRTLLANTEDAYQFPPFRQLAPAIVIGEDDHVTLRRKEREILASALGQLRSRWIATPDFSWADEIPRAVGVDGGDRELISPRFA